jgi:acylglycerol lipase
LTDCDHTQYFGASDGFKIAYRHWNASNQQRVLICIHGFGDYSGWFRNLAPDLAMDGSEVYAFDLRGFGQSLQEGSQRGIVNDFGRHLQDIDEFVQYFQAQHKGKQLYILGHSLGGVYSLWYVANHPLKVDGLVLAAPAVTCNINNTYSDKNRDPEEITIMQNDPLETWTFTENYLSNVQSVLLNSVLINACRIRVPTLVLQGSADVTVQPHGAKELHAKLVTSDKELVLLDGVGHWFNDALSPALPRVKCDPLIRAKFVRAIKIWLQNH